MGLGDKNLFKRVAELAKRQDFSTDGGTVYSIVYITASPTFTGVIGGYTTLTGDPSDIDPEATASPIDPADSASGSTPFTLTQPVVAQTSLSTSTLTTTNVLTSPAIRSSTSSGGAVAPASATADSSTTTSSSSSDGLSTGAKAGIAIGAIAVVGLIAAFLLWMLGKKRREREAQAAKDNEKANYGAGAAATEMVSRSPPSGAAAPRLSLRPVSRMMPEFLGSSKGRMSGGNLLNTIGESDAAQSRGLAPSPQPRGPGPVAPRPDEAATNNPFADPQNPFADPEKSMHATASGPSNVDTTPAAPIAPLAAAAVASGALAASTKSVAAPAPAPVHAPAPAPAVDVPAPLAVPAPVSPPGSQPDSQTSSPAPSAPVTPVTPVPIVGAGSGPEPPQGNVFRILMDFKPSMEDELELKAGQLVRMLHEYDDGWALCIRLDRSQQGVVPRTCLAAKPSKPKPSHLNQYARPPPGGAMSRPMSPAGMPPRPMSPGGRAMSPAGHRRPMSPAAMRRPMSPAAMRRPMSPAGRPMSPAGRPMSPAGRPMSPAGARRPSSPSGRPMSSAGSFNLPPRPLSPNFRPQPKRSNSPGPYNGRAGPPPMATVSRRRSNSVGDAWDRRTSPVGPSKLGLGSGIAL